MKTYTELVKLKTFAERLAYLKLDSRVGSETFGYDRWLNQRFYSSKEWRKLRNDIITRDCGRDLGVEGYEINSMIVIHHMNPITQKDIIYQTDILMNPEYLICVSDKTHKAIHYGTDELPTYEPIIRTPGDTCPWK